MINNYKREREKQIDTIIFNELNKNLNVDTKNANLVTEEFLNNLLNIILSKKETIRLLFSKNFTLTEHNIKQKLLRNTTLEKKPDLYNKIANKILSKRIEQIFNRLMEKNKKDNQFIAVCIDRQIFINTILSQNIESSFIESCLEDDEPLR